MIGKRFMSLVLMGLSVMVVQKPLTAQVEINNGTQAAIASPSMPVDPAIHDLGDLPQSLQTLAKATILDSAHTGLAATPGQNYLAYQQAKSLGMAVYPQLQTLQTQATPVGQLYLAALIRHLDPEAGQEMLIALRGDRSKIMQISGCVVSETTVSEMASQLLNNSTAFDL